MTTMVEKYPESTKLGWVTNILVIRCSVFLKGKVIHLKVSCYSHKRLCCTVLKGVQLCALVMVTNGHPFSTKLIVKHHKGWLDLYWKCWENNTMVYKINKKLSLLRVFQWNAVQVLWRTFLEESEVLERNQRTGHRVASPYTSIWIKWRYQLTFRRVTYEWQHSFLKKSWLNAVEIW